MRRVVAGVVAIILGVLVGAAVVILVGGLLLLVSAVLFQWVWNGFVVGHVSDVSRASLWSCALPGWVFISLGGWRSWNPRNKKTSA